MTWSKSCALFYINFSSHFPNHFLCTPFFSSFSVYSETTHYIHAQEPPVPCVWNACNQPIRTLKEYKLSWCFLELNTEIRETNTQGSCIPCSASHRYNTLWFEAREYTAKVRSFVDVFWLLFVVSEQTCIDDIALLYKSLYHSKEPETEWYQGHWFWIFVQIYRKDVFLHSKPIL